MKAGDLCWFHPATRGGYGWPTTHRDLPVVFNALSKSGKRANVKVLNPAGEFVACIFVSPRYLKPREQPAFDDAVARTDGIAAGVPRA